MLENVLSAYKKLEQRAMWLPKKACVQHKDPAPLASIKNLSQQSKRM